LPFNLQKRNTNITSALFTNPLILHLQGCLNDSRCVVAVIIFLLVVSYDNVFFIFINII